ncbi:L,D-transpeptidase family protein [Flavobacterium sp.]|uniref:L,D-transpeptidase family protein n=1 Tax=Flavobacterium sp. TaxID=239 RepID=UPI00286DA9B7|nr:L,D-transpeptidase family protein [Flavobacterium sp.]
MKSFLPILFCFFIYFGCGNITNSEIALAEKSIKKLEVVIGDWKTKKNRKQLIEAIKESILEGLTPSDYSYSKLIAFEEKYNDLSELEIETYEKQLSASFIKYISHLSNGKIKPREIYTDWDIKKNKIDADSLLTYAIEKKEVEDVIKNCKPKHTIYSQLKTALIAISSMPKEDFKPIITSEKFNLGSKSKTVILIKKRLQYWNDLSKKDTLSEFYDESFGNAIKQFQQRHGLEADGVIGKGTIQALNVTQEQRRRQIIANLERWRWFPRDLGINHIVVNIPNFNLHAVQGKDTTKIFKVVVGTEKRRTPVLSSKIDNIVFNPTWTVPPTILKEDLIPGTIKNRKYITNRNITIYDKKGKEIPIGNWRSSLADDYKYVQSPGENNALGYVKINFPNNHSVYLHDTNHRELFVKNMRSLSSGCVRVENPLKLAEYLLYNKEGYDATKIDSIVFFKKTKTVKMEEEIDVHILYFTAWYEDGTMQFRNDIYNYDPELFLRLTNQFRSNLVTPVRVVNK